MVPVGAIVPVTGIVVAGIIDCRTGIVVVVVGMAVPVVPEVIMWPPVAGAAHWPLAHGAAAVVVRDPQQLLHPTAPEEHQAGNARGLQKLRHFGPRELPARSQPPQAPRLRVPVRTVAARVTGVSAFPGPSASGFGQGGRLDRGS